MDAIRKLTGLQIIGIILVVNGALIGSTAQLTDLFGPMAVKYIVAIASLGNSIFGGIVTMMSGQGSMIRNVAAMPGVDSIKVNALANSTLATIAIDKAQDKVEATPGASATVIATAKAAAAVLLLAIVLAGLFAGDARAQQPRLTGNIVRDIQAANPTRPNLTGSPLNDIIGALDAKLLPDLQYALKLADASGSKVTGPCYKAWIDIINTRQKAVQAADGTDMPMPDPHIVTEFEKLVELRNSLQPDSEFMIKCSPVASMVKKDIVGFIGLVLSGGAGLATLVPGL